MDCDFNGNWDEIKTNMEAWWSGRSIGRPLIAIQAPRLVAEKASESIQKATPREFWTEFDVIYKRHLEAFKTYHFAAETYPRFYSNLGPTGLAAFLGSEPIFRKETVWYQPSVDGPCEVHAKFDPNNPWLLWSLGLLQKGREVANGEFLAGILDLCEHVDVAASLLGTQTLLVSMMDEPSEIHRLLEEIQDCWLRVYDLHCSLNAVNGFSSYGPFQIMGKGRVAKLQCDASAMLSPAMFDEFALPLLSDQTQALDRSMYHLDGEDAIRHLDAVLSMEGLNALQWTPGAGKADGGDECWDFIYERALNKGKSIYALVHPKNFKRFVKKFGASGVFIATTAQSAQDADFLVEEASRLCS
ncbi:MAG: hypothetical protein LBU32_08350 [Clostridiales bacterium]|jgi:5-methyltetrahydrofolate--homocysteine methyltransferase|nr:hypothetical protein [Clostridiales bacterium]